MIRVARGTTEIEGVELDEGKDPVRCHFHRRPTGRHAYLQIPDANARPEYAMHGLPGRRHGAAAVAARAELLRWLDPLSLDRGAMRRHPGRIAAALIAVELAGCCGARVAVCRSVGRPLRRRPSTRHPSHSLRGRPRRSRPLAPPLRSYNLCGPLLGPCHNSSPPARPAVNIKINKR